MTGGPHKQRQYKSTGALTRFLVVSPENPRPPFLPRRPTRFALIHYSYPPNQPLLPLTHLNIHAKPRMFLIFCLSRLDSWG